jgi:hypothetical protein
MYYSKMNTGHHFPSLRILEPTMSNNEVHQTFDSAFGGDAVLRVTKAKGSRIVHINNENQQRLYLWDEFYEALDEYGAVWIKAEYLGDEEYPQTHIEFLKEPREGYWEVHYAKKTPPRRSTTSGNPRVGPDGKVRHSPVRPWPPVVIKRCCCTCSCGAKPLGTAI